MSTWKGRRRPGGEVGTCGGVKGHEGKENLKKARKSYHSLKNRMFWCVILRKEHLKYTFFFVYLERKRDLD